MGLFWDHFKKELRFPPIFRPGPIAMLVDGAAAVLDTVREVILQLRDQFFPALCEETYLKRYAASRGIVRAILEPEEYWLMRVKFAYLFWARGGRASSMAEALRKGFGFTWVDVNGLGTTESLYDEITGAQLFDETSGDTLEGSDEARWAEFIVTVYLTDDAQQFIQDQVIWAINEVKPARSRLAAVVYIAPLWDETTGEPLYDENTAATKLDGPIVSSESPRYVVGNFGQALMVEEGTSNLAPNPTASELWGKVNCDVIPNAVAAPDGTLTAEKVVCDGGEDPQVSVVVDTMEGIAGKTFTYSVWLWTEPGQEIAAALYMYDAATITKIREQLFLLTSVPVRYYITFTFPVDTVGSTVAIRVDPQGLPAAGESLYMWGVQLEEKAYPSSFVEGTRDAEIFTVQPTNILSTSEGTIEAWVKPVSYAAGVAGFNWIIANDPGNDGAGFFLGMNTQDNTFAVRYGNGTDLITLSGFPLICRDTWYHVAACYGADGVKLYVNGDLIAGNASRANLQLALTLGIGCHPDGTNQFNGLLSDLRISRRARTSFEIFTGYNSGSPLPVDSDTTAKYAFNNTLYQTAVHPILLTN